MTSTENTSTYEDPDWEGKYARCPRWSNVWTSHSSSASDWPEGIRFSGPYIIEGGKIAVPLGLQKIVIRQHHADMIHAGFPRLWHHLDLKYAWAKRGEAKKFSKVVRKSVWFVRHVHVPQG